MTTEQQLSNASDNKWRMIFHNNEDLTFKLKTCPIPGMGFDPVKLGQGLPNKIPHSGDHIEYEDLNCQVFIDGNWANYIKVHKWIKSNVGKADPETYDATLQLLDPTGINQNISIRFENMYPNRVDQIDLNTIGDVTDMFMNINFLYDSYDFELAN